MKVTLVTEAKAIMNLYTTRGFVIPYIHADGEFVCIRNEVLPSHLNITDPGDHVPEVERSILIVKEQIRAITHGLPFRRLPRVLVRGITEHAVKVLNQFPAKNGASDTISPLAIMTGLPCPDYNSLKVELGSYCQVFEDNDPTNTMRAKETGAIALTPTGNTQGGYYFMSLVTGRRVSRKWWDELPMPQAVIDAVETMTERENQPLLVNGEPIFEWTPGTPIIENDENENDIEDGDDNDTVMLQDAVDDNDVVMLQDALNQPVEMEQVEDMEPQEVVNIDTDGEVNDESSGEDNSVRSAKRNTNINVQVEDVFDEEDGTLRTNDDAKDLFLDMGNDGSEGDISYTEPRSEYAGTSDDSNISYEEQGSENDENGIHNRYNLRGAKTNYGFRLDHVMDNPESSQSYDVQLLQAALDDYREDGSTTNLSRYITGFIVTQMTAKAGIKKHGDVAIEALMIEFQQLYDITVFKGVNPTTLTQKQKAALRAINLIKEKRCGKIKARSVADGRPQRNMYDKDKTASPTVSTDALLMSMMIDAWEKRDVASADVVGAYLHVDLEDFTLIKYEGESVDILCAMNPEWTKLVVIENGKKVL